MAAGIGHNKPFVGVNTLTDVEKRRLRNAVIEMNDSLTRVAAERDLQKETINKISEDLSLDKKLVRRMAKVYFKANFKDELESDNTFQEFYEQVLNKTVS